MCRVLTSQLPNHIGDRVTMMGWLHNVRRLGRVNFLILRDRAGLAQAVVGPDELHVLDGLHLESVLALTGTVVMAPAVALGAELSSVDIEVISPVRETPPFELNKPGITASLPVFLDHAVVGQRHPRQQAVLRIAAGVVASFRLALEGMGFTEIFTPKIVASATESGTNVFQIDYFGQAAFLAQSPQFYKQIMVGVFERVFEVTPVFRAEPHATSRHINQYTSLDVEFGFIENHFTVMALLTDVLRAILAHLEANYAKDIELLDVELPRIGDAIPSVYYPEAQELIYQRESIDVRGEPDLAPEHERALGRWSREVHQSDFVFVPGYPMAKRPFYTHPNPDDPVYSNAFDLLFRGTELVTGGQRLHLYEDYVVAIERAGYELEPYAAYLECFRHGMPPHGGFAIGLERFLMQLLGVDNIRWVTLFPRDLTRLLP